jgi:hypothetical protein
MAQPLGNGLAVLRLDADVDGHGIPRLVIYKPNLANSHGSSRERTPQDNGIFWFG